MPLNPFDATFVYSFQKDVLPELTKRGIAVLGMKPLSGKAQPVKKGVLTAEEALRYAMSLPVTTTICGMEKPEVLAQNLKLAQNFTPMTPDEMKQLEEKCVEPAADARFEPYKVSLQFDNPEARWAHGFPVDTEQKEIKEMIKETDNTGLPYPEVKSVSDRGMDRRNFVRGAGAGRGRGDGDTRGGRAIVLSDRQAAHRRSRRGAGQAAWQDWIDRVRARRGRFSPGHRQGPGGGQRDRHARDRRGREFFRQRLGIPRGRQRKPPWRGR